MLSLGPPFGHDMLLSLLSDRGRVLGIHMFPHVLPLISMLYVFMLCLVTYTRTGTAPFSRFTSLFHGTFGLFWRFCNYFFHHLYLVIPNISTKINYAQYLEDFLFFQTVDFLFKKKLFRIEQAFLMCVSLNPYKPFNYNVRM